MHIPFQGKNPKPTPTNAFVLHSSVQLLIVPSKEEAEEAQEASRPTTFPFKKLKLHHSTQLSQVMLIYINYNFEVNIKTSSKSYFQEKNSSW